jgi:hypothetical protein
MLTATAVFLSVVPYLLLGVAYLQQRKFTLATALTFRDRPDYPEPDMPDVPFAAGIAFTYVLVLFFWPVFGVRRLFLTLRRTSKG